MWPGVHVALAGQSAVGIAVVLEFLLLFFQEKRRREKFIKGLKKIPEGENFFICFWLEAGPQGSPG